MKAYQAVLKEHEIFQSMFKKETCYDNSAIENFFGLMKQEMYYGKIYQRYKELEGAMIDYIRYYQEEGIKEKLNGLSPAEYRKGQAA